jgi:hypothetical protein
LETREIGLEGVKRVILDAIEQTQVSTDSSNR